MARFTCHCVCSSLKNVTIALLCRNFLARSEQNLFVLAQSQKPEHALSFSTTFHMKNILILCTGNSCRSQIAHGYLEKFTDGRKVRVYSAGVETHGVNPMAIATMRSDGIDISRNTSNHVDEYRNIDFDLILTVCDHALERCPYFPSKAKKVHHNFPDPAKATGSPAEIETAFARVRDMIKAYVHALAIQEGLAER